MGKPDFSGFEMNAILRVKAQHHFDQGSQTEIALWAKVGPTK